MSTITAGIAGVGIPTVSWRGGDRSLIKTNVNVSTGVCIVNTHALFDTENIFWHINPDSNNGNNGIISNDSNNMKILGIKYHDHYKGDVYTDTDLTKRTSCFFNQVTFTLYNSILDKDINIKIFNNGTCQISGIKTIDQASIALLPLLDTIRKVQGVNTIKVIVFNGIWYNKKEYLNYNFRPHTRFEIIKIYDISNKCVIGEKKGNDIIIYGLNSSVSNRIYVTQFIRVIDDITIDCFIEQKLEKSKTKRYLFSKTTGKVIGHIIYDFIRKKKIADFSACSFREMKSHSTDTHLITLADMYSKNEIKLGTEQLVIIKSEILDLQYCKSKISDNTEMLIDVPFICMNSEVSIDTDNPFEYQLTSLNINFKLMTSELSPVLLLREQLNNILISKYHCNSSYIPENRYPAIKLKLYFDPKNGDHTPFNELKNGIEYITNSLSIFENGSILTFSSRSLTQFERASEFLLNLLNKELDQIIRKPKQDFPIVDPDIDIWDLLM